MKRIVIIGGGFAGLSAAAYLQKHKKQVEVVLVDRKRQFNFLPLLPDLLSRRMSDKFLCADLAMLGEKCSFRFINSTVQEIDRCKNKVSLKEEDLFYEYLIIAAGCQTNFYGNNSLSKDAFKLDDVSDAKRILKMLDSEQINTFVIGGGGYTGVEIATNIWRYFSGKGQSRRIVIIEKAEQLLAVLPEWMKKYVENNLSELGIKVYLNAQIESYSGSKIGLKNGETFERAALIWAAGVKGQDFIKSANALCDNQGRIIVDEYLRLGENCFCCGDSAHFKYKDYPLRMAVQFSIKQGMLAAENIMHAVNKRKIKKYLPLDLGYIIPMANNKACGNVLGLNIKGKIAVLLHYCMCVFRTYFFKNRVGIIRNLLRGS